MNYQLYKPVLIYVRAPFIGARRLCVLRDNYDFVFTPVYPPPYNEYEYAPLLMYTKSSYARHAFELEVLCAITFQRN